MEKFILVPYEKYQRLLQPQIKGSGEGRKGELVSLTPPGKKKKSTTTKRFGDVKADGPPKVSLPPPGERKKSIKRAEKAQKIKIDWISF